jgi:catechol 2,3-dioxygenase-like lactoylglutathione lyase family enzyme
MTIDHTGINVSNFEKSKEFYAHVLAPLGYQLSSEFNKAMAGFVMSQFNHNLTSLLKSIVVSE